MNVRKQIGNAIGEQAARDGKDIERAIAQQVKRGATDRDVAWMREGYEATRARMAA